MMLALITTLCFCLFAPLTHAFPLFPRDVFNPHITSPDAKTVWTVGETNTVTWDTSNLPPDSQLTNPNGMVVLGFLTADSENLMLDHPLAKDFKLSAGKVSITVPDVPTRDDYIIVLFGDSGNASPKFVINGAKAPSSTSSTSTTTQTLTTETVITTPNPMTSAGDTESSPAPSPPNGDNTTSGSPTTQSAAAAAPSSPSPLPLPPSSSSSSGTPSALAASTPSPNAAWKSQQWGSTRAICVASVSLVLFYAL